MNKFRQLYENCASFVKDKKNYTFNSDDVREPYVDSYEKVLKKRNKKDCAMSSQKWEYGQLHLYTPEKFAGDEISFQTPKEGGLWKINSLATGP